MYYGNPKAPASGNGQLTFDPDYTLVYHFGETGTPPRDTTAYGNHAQSSVATIDGTVIGKGAQFTGPPLALPASPSLAVQAGGSLTCRCGCVRTSWARSKWCTRAATAERTAAGHRPRRSVRTGRWPAQHAGATDPGGQWSHLAVVASGQKVALYMNGRPASTLAASMPALNTPATIGADSSPAPAVADGAVAAAPLGVFAGAIDELRLSSLARPAPLLLADAVSQGADSRLVAFGDENSRPAGAHFGFILAAMPFDAWLVVSILGLMLIGRG